MSALAQIIVAAVSAGLPTLTVLVSLLINNQRLSDLGTRKADFEKRMDQRFLEADKRTEQRLIDLRDLLRSEFFRVEQVMSSQR